MNDIIFVSMEDWDEIWRRNQFLCAAYASRFPECKILFVSPPRDVSHQLRHGSFSGLRQIATETAPGFPQVTITRPLKLLPNTLAIGRRFNNLMMRRHVARVARDTGLSNTILWLNPHFAVHMAGRMGESAVIYDITDDWISLTQSPALARLTALQDEALCRRADAVIVCSERLHSLKKKLARKLHLIPNGVDVGHYCDVLDKRASLSDSDRSSKRPVIGYTGTIHPDRVDVELVEELAKRMPDLSIVLVGPNHLTGDQKTRLSAFDNLIFTGPVAYRDIPETMRSFDVCITPHRRTAFTESLNPIKLWEYLAAGLPIVSTNVAGFRDFPDLVRIANGAEEFEMAVRAALCEGPSLAEDRRREAARHSWESRLDHILCVMSSINPQMALPAVPRTDQVNGK